MFPLIFLQVPPCPGLLLWMRLVRGRQVNDHKVAAMFLIVLSTAASYFFFFSHFITEKQNNQSPDVLVPGLLKVQGNAF